MAKERPNENTRTDRRPTATVQAKRSEWKALWEEISEILTPVRSNTQMRTTNATGRHSEHLREPGHLERGRTNRRRIAEWSIEDTNTRVRIVGGLTHAPAWEVRTTSTSPGALARHTAVLHAIEHASARHARRRGAKGLWISPEPISRAQLRTQEFAEAVSVVEPEPERERTPAPRKRLRGHNALALTLGAGLAVAAMRGEPQIRTTPSEE